MVDLLTDYSWILWLALILIFAIVEVTTLEFTFLMLAVGSLGGLLSGLAGLPWWASFLLAAVLSVLLLFAVRPALLRALKRGGDSRPTNVDALIGLSGIVVNDFVGKTNHVKLTNGETWTAKLADQGDLVEGERVVVTAIDGATAVVAPTERTAS
ncbi:MAG: NfeD family protein [Rhodoglobus sp.]